MSETVLSLTEEQAFQLSRAAIMLDKAKSERSLLAEALEVNLTVWVALRSIITREDCNLSGPVKENLVRLANFSAEKALGGLEKVTDSTIDALINVNLQISEGLLEGAKA
jgi:flagellar biosynthesis regulator FlaF